MVKNWLGVLLFLFFNLVSFSQNNTTPAARHWADSVFNTLTDEQRITQLMVLRLSEKTQSGVVFYDQKITEAIKKYNIGGICLFQGGPVKQANLINYFQQIARTPVMICIDAEWGLGMRFDSVIPLNHQLMLGALQDTSIVYQYGMIVGQQCRRAGVQVNFAPVVDINNNPDNPVINDRSFGEDKYKVASFGIQYMKGLQDAGVLACAKHFPGHGDVSVDSHLDLPVINKSREQLDSLELYPFRQIFSAGIGSVMVGHLFVPSIDSAMHHAASISKNNVTGLLRNELGYQGLTFTDALAMKGVAKYYPEGEIAVESLIAGNDMLCLPSDIPLSLAKIKEAIKKKKISWGDIYAKCKKVLEVKYSYGLNSLMPIDTANLTNDLNSKVNGMRKLVAENAITLLNNKDEKFFPLQLNANETKKIAYIGIGLDTDNVFSKRIKADYTADAFYFNYRQDAGKVVSMVELIKKNYAAVVIGIHNYSRYPLNNFGLSKPAIDFVRQLQEQSNCVTFVFGNPYAIKNFCESKNLVACYEDDSITQNTALDFLEGKISLYGKLPVKVCDAYPAGSGIVLKNDMPFTDPVNEGFDQQKLAVIDSIADDAILRGATPGCIVLAAKDGKIIYYKAFGHYSYDKPERVTIHSVYDLASVTKVCATTLAIMKLYDEKKIDLKKNLGYYLKWVVNSDKDSLLIENILLHQAGLVAWIPFYKETIDSLTKVSKSVIYSRIQNDTFTIRVADSLFMRKDWEDTMYRRMLQSPLGAEGRYVYSDNDFIFLGKIVEAITGKTLDKYVTETFYKPLGLASATFRPAEKIDLAVIAPTENEKYFRQQHLHGYVHDPAAAMFGGVSGHAGLFSDAYDLAIIMQMLLNQGTFNGRSYIKPETIKLFTSYNSSDSRRGLGFDKPEKDNATLKEPYPSKSVSPLTFGHTGFTGTCVWADPKYNIVFIFLSNRINPDGDNLKLSRMNVRGKIQEQIYKAMMN